ncbi:hypothetical protein ABT354_30465 [Streptomyces sp. NPDC000594]|uniref:hypothetical protein n=1 Tax=Streptomyces sp. NPDC000594 TaxID=3154261 RepID=UPI00332AEA32
MGIEAGEDGTLAMVLDHGDWAVVIGTGPLPEGTDAGGLKLAIRVGALDHCVDGVL